MCYVAWFREMLNTIFIDYKIVFTKSDPDPNDEEDTAPMDIELFIAYNTRTRQIVLNGVPLVPKPANKWTDQDRREVEDLGGMTPSSAYYVGLWSSLRDDPFPRIVGDLYSMVVEGDVLALIIRMLLEGTIKRSMTVMLDEGSNTLAAEDRIIHLPSTGSIYSEYPLDGEVAYVLGAGPALDEDGYAKMTVAP